MPNRKNASLGAVVMPATATTSGVLRPEELARHVQVQRFSCAAALAPWVEHLWSLRWDLPPGTSHDSSTLPHPACNLSVEKGHTRPAVGTDPVVVTGVVTRRFDVTLRGSGSVWGVKFRPGGLASLTGTPARELRDRTLPAVQLLPEQTVAPLRQLRTGDEWRAVMQQALMELGPGTDASGDTSRDEDYLALLDVVTVMLEDRSLVQVAAVAKRCGLSTRRLQRLFGWYVGVSPKWVLARYRMHDVVTALDDGYAGSMATLAATYGWFDQAHFTGEFTELVGVPPGRYRDRDRAPTDSG